MSSPYIKLKVVGITHETTDAITIFFEHPEKRHITFKPGQFLTLMPVINGKQQRRSYSLCSAPHEAPQLAVTVKRVPDGLVSNYLVDNLKEGDEMEVMEPIGNFNILCHSNNCRTVVLFGAGSGITPLMSIAKSVLKEEENSRVLLVYGNRNEDSVIFSKELEQMEQDLGNRFVVEHVYSQPKNDNVAHRGRMNRSMLLKILQHQELTGTSDAQYYMCGPEGMMEEVREALHLLKVPADRIHRESFVGTKSQDSDQHGTVSDGDDGEIKTQTVKVIYEGSEYEFEVEPDQTILEAALDQDIDLPYSCQAGLCTACRGKCLTGKVHLDEREGLSDAELNEGYVLNCVGHPLTSDVVIEIG